MAQKKHRCYDLLSALTPELTLSVVLSQPFLPRVKRTLQIRGCVIVLFKRNSVPDFTRNKLIILSRASRPVLVGSNCVQIQSIKLHFETGSSRDLFVRCVQHAIRTASSCASRYVPLREIGRGASGIVKLVRRRTDGELFAMKMISKAQVYASESKLQYVISERLILAQGTERELPYVLKLEEAFETSEHFCFVTELAVYGDLKAVLTQVAGNCVSEEIARQWFAELVIAVEGIHSLGALYRDVKVENVLIAKDGSVRLGDFGLAKRVGKEQMESDSEEDGGRLLGRANSFVGTRRYMSPEVLRGGRVGGYGSAADVWGLGVVLYVMVSGKYPFGWSDDMRELEDDILNGEVLMPKGMSENGKGILKGVLDKDELERMDLGEIKGSEWMKGVEWGKLKMEVEGGAAEMLERNQVGQIDDVEGRYKVENNVEVLEGSGSVMGEFELVGFGYRRRV